MSSPLTDTQRLATERLIKEETAKRHHTLVLSLSGAHAYGFPSQDSDVDLKGVHIDATATLLAMLPPPTAVDRMEVIDGVEVDYTSNEIRGVLWGILQGNGNYLERVTTPTPLVASPELASLQEILPGMLSRKFYRHYHGFASSQRAEFDKSGGRSAKKLLYVLRTALTGTHLLRTGKVETDLSVLAPAYGIEGVDPWITAKRAGERIDLDPGASKRAVERIEQVFERLDAAYAESVLPVEPKQAAGVDPWLMALRRRHFAD